MGIALLWTFVRRRRPLTEPLLTLQLFRNRVFTVAVSTNLLTVFALLGVMFYLPQYLILVLGTSPLVAGLWMLPLAGATVIGTLAAPSLARVLHLRWIIGGGMTLAAAGLAVATMLGIDGDRAVLITAGLLIGAGVGAAEALTNDAILTAAHPGRRALPPVRGRRRAGPCRAPRPVRRLDPAGHAAPRIVCHLVLRIGRERRTGNM
ncbi:MFS transporter [Blastococcus sp. LR1]|uniref:MFS transporter n=1 Tax=Blastococcus sp. LR1 TaxID=2877000 RepID=UPI00210619DE|nr:MFS transporter [Blastococcus sp. LR1]